MIERIGTSAPRHTPVVMAGVALGIAQPPRRHCGRTAGAASTAAARDQSARRRSVMRGRCTAQPDDGRVGGGADGLSEAEEAALLQDIARLQQKEGRANARGGVGASGREAEGGRGDIGDPSTTWKARLDKFLIADFFFILFALGFLGVGVAQKSIFHSEGIYLIWASLWEPVMQPALGIFMLGAIVSGIQGKLSEGDE